MIHQIVSGGASASVLKPIAKSVRASIPSDQRALWIGLTGGIGSGKSVVTSTWRQAGATIADADVIAREVVEPGTPGLNKIQKCFGPDVIRDGHLDRAALASIVFSNEDALADLNAITHPLIRARAVEILESAPAGGIAVYDAPVLIESGMTGMVDAVVVVTADVDARVDRLVNQRGMSPQDARNRIRAQMSDQERIAHASCVLVNNGTKEDLTSVATQLYDWLTH